MSAAKMVADSTWSDTDSRKKRSGRSSGRRERRSKKDRRRRRYSRSSSGGSTDSRRSRSASASPSDEYDSDIDLEKDLQPLGAYLRNPSVLLDQMLHSVRGSSLRRALPEVLKDMPMDELRKRCLEHLEVLSRKRMRRILAGDDPGAISSSGTEDEESGREDKDAEEGESKVDSTGEEPKDGPGGNSQNRTPGMDDSPLSLAAEDMDDPALDPPPPPPPPQRMEDEEEEEGEIGDDDDEEEGVGWEMEEGEDVAEKLFPEVEQDRMELLELEMRARAIKAMLALHEQRDKEHRKQRAKKK